MSVRDAAAKLGIGQTSLQKCKKKAGIITRKRQKAPLYNENQIERCKKACRLLVNKTAPKYGSKIIIIDDETYLKKNPQEMPNKSYVNIVPGVDISSTSLFVPTSKWPAKYGVWQAISSDGKCSPPVIINGCQNGQTYLDRCIKGVLLPWIRENFDIRDCLFWPD